MLWLIGIIVVIILISIFLAFNAKPAQNQEVYAVALNNRDLTMNDLTKRFNAVPATLENLKEAHAAGSRVGGGFLIDNGKAYGINESGTQEMPGWSIGYFLYGVKPAMPSIPADEKAQMTVDALVLPFVWPIKDLNSMVWSQYDKKK